MNLARVVLFGIALTANCFADERPIQADRILDVPHDFQFGEYHLKVRLKANKTIVRPNDVLIITTTIENAGKTPIPVYRLRGKYANNSRALPVFDQHGTYFESLYVDPLSLKWFDPSPGFWCILEPDDCYSEEFSFDRHDYFFRVLTQHFPQTQVQFMLKDDFIATNPYITTTCKCLENCNTPNAADRPVPDKPRISLSEAYRKMRESTHEIREAKGAIIARSNVITIYSIEPPVEAQKPE